MSEEFQTEDEPFISIGVKVLPTEIKGKSPVSAEFTISAGTIAEAYSVDFADGTHEAGVLVPDPDNEYMTADIQHIYQYKKGWQKYYSHTYYPVITVYGTSPVDGRNIQTTINTHETGRSLSILVSDPNYVVV
jgi:hypothetical protein